MPSENPHVEGFTETENADPIVTQQSEVYAPKQDESEPYVLGQERRKELDSNLVSSVPLQALEENDDPLDTCSISHVMNKRGKESATCSQAPVGCTLDDDLGPEVSLTCDAVHTSFPASTLDETTCRTISSLKQNQGKTDDLPHTNLIGGSESSKFATATENTAFLPNEMSNSPLVSAATQGTGNASSLASVDGNEMSDDVAAVCCDLAEMALRSHAQVNSDSSASLEPKKPCLINEEGLSLPLDLEEEPFAQDQIQFLMSGGSPTNCQKGLISSKHSAQSIKDIPRCCTSEVENGIARMGDHVERPSLNDVHSQEEFRPLKRQSMEQVTSTPVKLEAVQSPTSTLNCDILEGSYSGNCYHRDGSRLGKFKAMISALSVMLLNGHSHPLCLKKYRKGGER